MREEATAERQHRERPESPVGEDGSWAGGQRRILAGLATGAPLVETLRAIAELVETCAPGSVASIRSIEGERLRPGAAPSLPRADIPAIETLRVGGDGGPRDTAVATGARVVVEDIPAGPTGGKWSELARDHGLRSCWSTSIVGPGEAFLGTFAVYHQEARRPRDDDLRLIDDGAQLASIAIQHHRLQRAQGPSGERAAERERIRELLMRAPLPVAVLRGPDFVYEFANPAYERMFGRKGLTGRSVRDVFPEVEAAVIFGILDPVYHDGVTFNDPQTHVILERGNGPESAYFNVHVAPWRSSGGQVTGVFALALEVTDQVNARQEIDALRIRLAQVEKRSALAQLVSGVAHEVRTPLTYLATNLALVDRHLQRLTERLPPEDVASMAALLNEYLPSAFEAVDRIDHLVEDLRGFTQHRPHAIERCDLASVVRQGVALFQATNRGRVRVECELAEGLDIEVDTVQIQHAVINLLQNAMDAEPRDHVIRVRVEADGAGGAVVSVSDAGRGIPLDAQQHIFDPFYTTRGAGTGLGLSIVKRICQAHGAEVSFKTSPAGTTFRLALPSRVIERSA